MFRPLLLALSATSLATGQTVWVVDDDGGVGVDFLEIDDALAVAGPSDRIEVRPGSYRDFTVANSATIMGQPGVEVQGILVAGVPPGDRVVLTDILASLSVAVCAGTVVIDNRELSPLDYRAVSITSSDDVWLQSVRTSYLLIGGSTVFSDGMDSRGPITAGWGADGQPGAVIQGDSLVVLSRSRVVGGVGGCAPDPAYTPGTGGTGLIVAGTSKVVLIDTSLVGGGSAFDPQCVQSGPSGGPLAILQGATVHSNRTVTPLLPSAQQRFFHEPGLPLLAVSSSATSPGTADFELRAPSGAVGRNFMGRFTSLAPLGGATVPRAHNFSFGQFMGTAGSGPLTSSLVIPAGRRGNVFYAQGAATFAGGFTDLSNPVALVVR